MKKKLKDYTVVVRAPFDEDYPDDRYVVRVKATGPTDAAFEARLEAEFLDRGHREGQEKGANFDYEVLHIFEGRLRDWQKKKGKKL